MERDNGYEITPQNPGWIKKTALYKCSIPASREDSDDLLKRIIVFYVINTPCEDLSSSSLPLSYYGWNGKVWRNSALKKKLFEAAGFERGNTFIPVKHLGDMKKSCSQAKLSKGFHTSRDTERIVFYKPGRYNECLAMFYHIRNAFAHGRLAMFPATEDNDLIFVLEDGVKRKDKFQVRFRMVVKRSTLVSWINIIEKGSL